MGIVDKAKNRVEKTAGEVKEAVGKHRGDRRMQARGKKDQATAELNRAGDKVRDAVEK